MLQNLFRPRNRQTFGEPLYALAVAQARQPAFYARLGVADRIDARFELYTLHVLLLILRLRDEGKQGADLAQELFDTYVSALDHTLRELGVGDIVVGKKMRKLGESLFGRMNAYEPLIRAADPDGLAEALSRNVYEVEAAPQATDLARYTLASRTRLAAQNLAAAIKAPEWAEITA